MVKRVLKSDSDYRFTAMGIVSPLKGYRLCWFLNRDLRIDLVRQEDISLHSSKDRILQSFSHFTYCLEEDGLTFHVIENKGENGLMLPQTPQFDYFLLLEGHLAEDRSPNVIQVVKGIEAVQLVKELEVARFKGMENLIFD